MSREMGYENDVGAAFRCLKFRLHYLFMGCTKPQLWHPGTWVVIGTCGVFSCGTQALTGMEDLAP